MNIVFYYLRKNYAELIERYHKFNIDYRTIAEYRSMLIRDYECESVSVRESPGRQVIASWEIRSHGKRYFYNYDYSKKEVIYIGVR